MTLPLEMEEAFGPRVDKAVDKVGGLLPVEWSNELRTVIRGIVADAYYSGSGQSQLVEYEMRRSF
ncbi:hypothetical protein [Demequina sp.]|uniref:hypothetical protein n=1 Tax=Demequina sp. TaxID=2050685 RepID=UPI003D0FE295